jgi:hypothetical protein
VLGRENCFERVGRFVVPGIRLDGKSDRLVVRKCAEHRSSIEASKPGGPMDPPSPLQRGPCLRLSSVAFRASGLWFCEMCYEGASGKSERRWRGERTSKN